MKVKVEGFARGAFVIRRGGSRDYFALEHLHYLPKRPRTFAQVWVVQWRGSVVVRKRKHEARATAGRIAAVGVLSYPTLLCRGREVALMLERGPVDARRARWLNRHVRTISRVVVHPQFRGLGLAALLVRWMCQHCSTRYVEASAAMSRAHPLFEKGGMRRVRAVRASRRSRARTTPYFLFDRKEGSGFRVQI